MPKLTDVPLTVDWTKISGQIQKAVDEATAGIVENMALHMIGGEVLAEVQSARAKHGNQNHLPQGVGPDRSLSDEMAEYDPSPDATGGWTNADLEASAKARCQDAVNTNEGDTWEKIITEEWAEYVAAETPEDQRAELIQLAAMAISAIRALDSQGAER